MPGIVIIYNKKQRNIDTLNISNDISELMYESGVSQTTTVAQNNKISLKIAFKDKDYQGFFKTEEGFIAWYGKPLYKGEPFNESICDNIKRYMEVSKLNALINEISGSFQLVIYLSKSNECFVVSDKISSCPFYYTETNDLVVFTPEPLTLKALKNHNWYPTIRQESLFEFMASGHLWGDGSFWKEVKRLGPGQFIHLNRDDITINSYWKMIFESRIESEQSLIENLFEAIQNDINDLPKGKKILTLSGGFDSRALLGFLKLANQQFDTVGYSFGQNVNVGTDAEVGKYFADKLGISHRYYKAQIDEPNRLIADIKKMILATGGESHLVVMQDAFLGIEFYRNLAENYDYMIRGDEAWGWGDYAVNYDMAFWESRLFNLNEISHPKKIMKSEVFDNGIKYIERQRQKFIEECEDSNISANDLKDYLYWRHRESRLLQNMAYFRRCYIPHFAPFLFDRTLSVIKRTPSKFRVQKNLFINMGKKMFPELFLDNKAISPHTCDVNNFSFLYGNKKFRSFIKCALLESESDIFNNVFNRKSFEFWMDDILDGNCADTSELRRKHDLKRLGISFIGRSAYLKGCMKAFMVKKGMNTFPVLNVNYLFRLVVLSLALQEYGKD